MHVCSFVHDDTLPPELRAALEDSLFSALFTYQEQDIEVRDPAAVPVSVDPTEARVLEFAVRNVVRHARFARFTRGNHVLTERVAHDAVAWCANVWAQLEEEGRTESGSGGERAMLGALREDTNIVEALRVASAIPALERPAATVTRMRKRLLQTNGNTSDTASPARLQALQYAAAVDALGARWKRRLDDRELRARISFVHRALLPYVAELNAQVPAMSRYLESVKNIFGDSDRMWDLSRGTWHDVDVGALEEYASILSQEPSIARLARILGRGRQSRAGAPEVEQHVVKKSVPYSASAGRSEVNGVRFGNDVSSLLPSELSLLSSSETEPLFFKRFAESELLCLAYTTELTYYHTEYATETVRKVSADERGPIILCVDTSGSMAGMPERVAKAITLAVVKAAIQESRRAYLIAFSDAIRTLELTSAPDAVVELSEFLGKAFHGGTDLRPALDESLVALDREGFERADVLIVSDFRIPKILDRHIERIKRQQRNRATRFYSLTVNRAEIYDPFNIFDRSWLYDISHLDAPGIPVRSLTPL